MLNEASVVYICTHRIGTNCIVTYLYGIGTNNYHNQVLNLPIQKYIKVIINNLLLIKY